LIGVKFLVSYLQLLSCSNCIRFSCCYCLCGVGQVLLPFFANSSTVIEPVCRCLHWLVTANIRAGKMQWYIDRRSSIKTQRLVIASYVPYHLTGHCTTYHYLANNRFLFHIVYKFIHTQSHVRLHYNYLAMQCSN
jgi:hypothetical protein